MARTARIVAFVWHQRSSAIETRERLMDGLTSGSDRVVLATCLRVEVYAAAEALEPSRMLADIGLRAVESEMLEGVAAITHLFAVAAGLDSTVVGEPQILSQVRGAAATTRHPLLVAALSRALYVGRAVRARCGLSSTRSIGSLAVDALLSQVSRPGSARILVIGAGEMGKLALRALARRVDTVVVANRDPARAAALAEAHGALRHASRPSARYARARKRSARPSSTARCGDLDISRTAIGASSKRSPPTSRMRYCTSPSWRYASAASRRKRAPDDPHRHARERARARAGAHRRRRARRALRALRHRHRRRSQRPSAAGAR